MLRIQTADLSKVYPRAAAGGGDLHALAAVNFSVDPGEMFFLLGPSGCGKTTLLRILAGFVEPSAGRVLFDGRDVTAVPPDRRNLAMVFQNYALWPHMTVRRNVEFGPKTAGWPRSRRREVVEEMLTLVGMADRHTARPPQLSGGQQQRVALARALAVQPGGLLFDEPLSNLDARLRARMRSEIRRIVKDTGATAVYVTHDQEEALSMADRIAVMNAGRIEQVGPPREIYRQPATRFVADFLGEANFLPAKTAGREGGRLKLAAAAGPLLADDQKEYAVGQAVTCCIRPESVRIESAGDADAANTMAARCEGMTYFGQTTRYRLALAGTGQALLAVSLEGRPPAQPGQDVRVRFDPADVVVLTE